MKTILKHFTPNAGALVLAGLLFMVQVVNARSGTAPAQPLAASQTLISYQGTLTDENGVPINATVPMEFVLYDAASDGNLKWGPEAHDVPVNNGLFHVLLGSVTPIDPAQLVGDLWLDIKANGEGLAPREQLVSSAPNRLLVSGDSTSYVEGNLQIGNNAWTPAFASMDGNDMAVEGQFEQNGTGGARVYRLGIGTDPAANEGTLTLLRGIQTPFKILTERSWEFKQYDSGAGTKTALRSTIDAKHFQFRNENDSVILSIYANNSSGGYLSMEGHSITNCGALTEANLQTEEEIAAGRIDRFEEGDVLCWGDGRLEKCAQAADPLVQGVADIEGRPIVIGAEAIKVIGPVKRGDYLVASNVPGYAKAASNPAFGTVIAQALEDLKGERGLIKAMIRKM